MEEECRTRRKEEAKKRTRTTTTTQTYQLAALIWFNTRKLTRSRHVNERLIALSSFSAWWCMAVLCSWSALSCETRQRPIPMPAKQCQVRFIFDFFQCPLAGQQFLNLFELFLLYAVTVSFFHFWFCSYITVSNFEELFSYAATVFPGCNSA